MAKRLKNKKNNNVLPFFIVLFEKLHLFIIKCGIDFVKKKNFLHRGKKNKYNGRDIIKRN